MADNLRALEDWAGALLAKLEPSARRQLNQQIGRELRRSQQQRIAAQRNPDGSAFAPRKPRQLRAKKGRIKRQMFAKLRQAKHLKVQSSADAIAIGFMGRVARIARVHQYGLRDRPEKGQPDVQYDRRELLGFTDADLELIRDQLLQHLTG
ncbi:phage virion morphogenesis protein [Aquipseudomonas alcaligenes]|uniref:Bacteriophage tail completion protein S n=1 Tax=Aquipseudomonas alcaligenes TaxID=43263 RepID=A0AA37CF48_AQUAC|nr:phage virion morphogenesis protein [Pseudomonas alcaligenes]BCR26623.1 bacteriophage tail completion protein S [Pseudomonas alcaligenes]GIZ65781.1 bacteriophage tail completion protein S [Pseudomonas alcaligenes]GIZ70115.1 bacteriophage tail completion protein S [Pseudomonas alcaligenes]GIZ74468.1 bacteriophage tail completion protein S [Pseudomonas alcaligenes]GIZ78796.1 bacteriophage tail completion protein S [Pseudomonas alcaligenes]